jgi:carboxylesterase type B
VRVYHPSKPGPAEAGALIYVHGGGFIVGTLDQFDTAMRLFSEISGAQVYSVDYKLAPEYQWPTQIEETEFVVRWLFEHAAERGVDPKRIGLGGTSPARSVSSCEMKTVRSWRCRCRSTLKPKCRFSRAPVSKMFPAVM